MFRIFNSTKKNIDLFKVYKVNEEVHLLEFLINREFKNFNISDFTQKVSSNPLLNQTPYDEKFLNLVGSEIVGDDLNPKSISGKTRLVFFFHYLELDKPLNTPFGKIVIPEAIQLPDRLSSKITYNAPS